jgi:apolipoprotein N-acyltransferase
MERNRRTWIAIGAACASGGLLGAAAPDGLSPWLAWIALAPAAAATLAWRGTVAGRLAVPLAYGIYLELTLIPALPFGIASGQWGDPPPVMIGDSPVVFVALLLVPAFALILYAIRFGEPWGAARLPEPLRPAASVAIPASAFAALDFVRVNLDPGGLWGPLFLSQHGSDSAAIASLGGPWLLSFAIAASGYAFALVGLFAIERFTASRQGPIEGLDRRPGFGAVVAPAAAAVLILAALAAGSGLDRGGGRLVTVAAVQPGYDTAEEDRWQTRNFEPDTYDLAALDLIRDLSPLTRGAAEAGAELVVWPEGSVWVDPAAEPRVRAALVKLAGESRASILVPYFNRDLGQGATIAVLADGTFTDTQPKQRPMWFLGENGDNRRPPEAVETGPARLGTMLGVDNQGPGVARRLAGGDAELLASATHDWEQLSAEQRAFAAINAVATGTPLVRADWRYGSAVYDAGGEVVADAGRGLKREVLIAPVALRAGQTPYTGLGDLLGWAFLVLSVAAGVTVRRWRSPAGASATAPSISSARSGSGSST